jgi:hypothetical protein
VPSGRQRRNAEPRVIPAIFDGDSGVWGDVSWNWAGGGGDGEEGCTENDDGDVDGGVARCVVDGVVVVVVAGLGVLTVEDVVLDIVLCEVSVDVTVTSGDAPEIIEAGLLPGFPNRSGMAWRLSSPWCCSPCNGAANVDEVRKNRVMRSTVKRDVDL